jgi:hypothetical protein
MKSLNQTLKTTIQWTKMLDVMVDEQIKNKEDNLFYLQNIKLINYLNFPVMFIVNYFSKNEKKVKKLNEFKSTQKY